MSLTLQWNRLFPSGRVSLISWSRKTLGEEFPLHDHDFPEVFWISAGCLQHELNGVGTELPLGRLMFIRPADRHAFRGIDARGGTVCNFAVRPDIVAHLRERYFAGQRIAWWHEAEPPPMLQLAPAELHLLDHAARELAATGDPDLHATERFLLNLFHLLRQRDAPVRLTAEPAWLAAARVAMNEPRHLARGVPQLVRFAGCSAEHLARTVRRVHGVTPTDLVNQLRLGWAAAELQYSGRTIADVALAAGFESLSHFYHLFRRQHGVTPRQFRLRARALA